MIAVEANPELATLVWQGIYPGNASFRVLNRAISVSAGQQTCFFNRGSTESRGIVPCMKGGVPRILPRVNTTTCKALVDEYGTPFLLKLDVEGQEIACLSSLLQLARQKRLPKLVIFESPLYKCRRRECVDGFLDVVRRMTEAGYGEWKRQWWPKQSGHNFIGDEVLDHRGSGSYTKGWVNGTVVATTGCGIGLLPKGKDIKYLRDVRMNSCDFHARHTRPWAGYTACT